MRALIVDRGRLSGVRLATDRPEPLPGPGEVLIRVARAGICSTDLELARGYLNFTGVLGHEFVGTVIRGSDALTGRRVVAEINCAAPGSPAADAEQRKHVRPRTVLGIVGRDGAFADYVTVPTENCHVVPTEVSDAEAVFVEPLAAAVQVTLDAPLPPGRRVTVLGSGRLGILCAQVLAAHGAQVDIVGRNPVSLAACRQLGLATVALADAKSAANTDMVVECTGSPDGLRLAMSLVKPRGTIVLKSTYVDVQPIDLAPIVIHEIRVVGSRCGPYQPALLLLQQRRVRVAPLVTSTFPLDRAEEAMASANDAGQIKVQLEMEPR